MSASSSRQFTHQLVDLLFDHVEQIGERPVVDWKAADALRELVRLDAPAAEPLELARLVADWSIQLHHPSYMGHQVCPPIAEASAADLLISVLNQSTAVAEMSPIATQIEKEIVRWIGNLAGYPATSEGTAVSGGSAANLTALMAARARWQSDPANATRKPIIVTSADAHYSVARAAAIMGLDPTGVLKIATDAKFRLDLDSLVETLAAIEAREDVSLMAIVATSGSTATGAFDRLDEIALLRDRYRGWLHVDAAHGGAALLSEELRALVHGLERSDSFSCDPHKMMWTPLSLGLVLVRDGNWLRRAFHADAPYLFHGGSGNIGEMTIQCSKRADAIKLWLVLRAFGTRPIVDRLQKVTALARALHRKLEESDDFEPLHEPEMNILCFRKRGLSNDETAALRERLVRSGRAWITSTLLRGERVLRVTLMNPETSERELDGLLSALREV